jgi:hypothetical protein
VKWIWTYILFLLSFVTGYLAWNGYFSNTLERKMIPIDNGPVSLLPLQKRIPLKIKPVPLIPIEPCAIDIPGVTIAEFQETGGMFDSIPSPKEESKSIEKTSFTSLLLKNIGKPDSPALLSNISWTKGITGTEALEFNGYDSICSYTHRHGQDLRFEGTIELLISMKKFIPNAGLVHKGEYRDWSDESYSLQFQEKESDGVLFSMINDAGETLSVTSSYSLNADQWIHLAVTWDKKSVSLYINGIKDREKSNTIGSLRASTGNLQLGSQLPGLYNQNQGTLSFYGSIDEFALYNRPLTENEVIARHRAFLGQEKPPMFTAGSVTMLLLLFSSTIALGISGVSNRRKA